MTGVPVFAASTTASAPGARALVVLWVALALAAAPWAGLAWPSGPSGDAAESGAVVGVVPWVADPGHRMGKAAPTQLTPQPTGAAPTTAHGGLRKQARASSVQSPDLLHRWLQRILVGARMQSDGG